MAVGNRHQSKRGTATKSQSTQQSTPDDEQTGEVSLYVPATNPKERLWMLEMDARLKPFLDTNIAPPPEQSTLRKYFYRARKALRKYGNSLRGLKRDIASRGNKRPKADPQSVALAKNVISGEHLTPIRSTEEVGYGLYVHLCGERNLFPISDTWFNRLIELVPIEARIKAREGRHRAYSHERGTGPHFLDPDRNGGYYFGRAHVDTTEIPNELLCRYTGIRLGKANLIAMVDSFSLDILAYLITLLPVTRGVVLALFRLCAFLHRRLPREIFIDGGPDLQAIDVRFLGAQANTTIVDRRTKHGRDGRPVEGTFGVLQARLWPNLAGNTQNSKYPRAMSKEVNPRLHAIHTIDTIDELFRKFLDDEYRTNPVGTMAASPNDLKAYSLQQHGTRPFRPIANDRNLLIATSPTARPVMSKIHPRRGIILAPFEYWSDCFSDVSIAGRLAERRKDYLNGSRIFASVDDEWLDAVASPHPLTNQMSSRELQYLTVEYEKRHQRKLELRPENLDSLGSFIQELREEEAELRALLKYRGDKAHLDSILGNTWANDPNASAHPPTVIPKPNRLYGIETA